MENLTPANINKSNTTLHFDYTKEADWLIPVSTNIVLTFVTIWFLISLLYYGINSGKWSRIEKSHSDKLNAGLIYTSVILCALICLLRYVASLVYMNIGFGEGLDSLCDTVADVAFCLYGMVLYSSYLFLWFRQRVFYSAYIMRKSINRVFSFFSTMSIVIIFVAGISATLINTLPKDHPSSIDGCMYNPDEKHRTGYWISGAVAISIGQFLMLGLFAYPLFKIFNLCESFSSNHCSNKTLFQLSSGCPENNELSIRPNTVSSSLDSGGKETSVKFHPGFRRATANRVSHILGRTLLFAVLSLSTDIFLLVFSNYIVETRQNRRVPSMIYDINSFLNLLLLIFSFVKYKDMMSISCQKRRKNRVRCKTR